MTLKLAQFWDDPKKITTKSSYPQKIFIFQKTPKNIEIQNFEPQKMDRAYVCVKISEYPPPPSWAMSYELNPGNLGDITRASHELLHRLTRHKCNIVRQAHEILAHSI